MLGKNVFKLKIKIYDAVGKLRKFQHSPTRDNGVKVFVSEKSSCMKEKFENEERRVR